MPVVAIADRRLAAPVRTSRSTGMRIQIGSGPLLYTIMGIQMSCAALFTAFFAVDVSGLTTRPAPYTLREVVQIAAAVGLVLSIVLNAVLIRKVIQRAHVVEQSMKVASGAIHDLMETEFDRWRLTAAEREVALYAIKGCSNAEIAEMTGKSEGTVKSQSNAVFRKARVSGRVGLVTHFIDDLLSIAP